MKLSAAQIPGFLRRPPTPVAAVLIYGADDGLVRERADQVTAAVLGKTGDDPFRLTLLTGDAVKSDPALLADEAASLSLMGGRRVVRVRDTGDALSKTLQYVLDQPRGDALIVIEAGDLGRSSSLRKLAETADGIAAIACYADGPRELAALIREVLGSHRITIAEDALEYLVQNLGGDRMLTRQEIEKLALYAGDGGRIDLAAAISSVGDTSALDIDEVVYDALDGRAPAVNAALTRLFLEGESSIRILRAAQRHVQRLHLAGSQVAEGEPADAVIRGLRPPLFFKLVDRFRRQLEAWPPERTQRLSRQLTQAEMDCKHTGYPDETVCRQILTTAGYIRRNPVKR